MGELYLSIGRLSLAIGGAAASVLAAVVVTNSLAGGDGDSLAASESQIGSSDRIDDVLDQDEVREFADFELYWLGDSFKSLPLKRVSATQTVGIQESGFPNEPENYVQFIYGSCDTSQGRCAPPLGIQVWSACVRNPSMYPDDRTVLPREDTIVRGVPSANFGDGRLELYSGAVAIVIFAESQELALSAANALAPANGRATLESDGNLVPPVDGALEGNVQCDEEV